MPATTPAAPAGRRRFWVTVLVFAVANLAAWGGYVWYDQVARVKPLLRVESFTPGDGATVGPRPVFVWTFNLDAAPSTLPATAPASAGAAEPAGTITPPTPGKWVWRDGRTLTFTPDADLPKATRFTVALAADRLRTADGFRLDKPFAAAVQTSPLALAAVRQTSFENDQLVIELEFDDTVIPADVAQHLSLAGGDGKPIQFVLHGEAAGKVVRVRTDPLPAARVGPAAVNVRLSPGLAGRGGPLGLTAPAERALTVGTTLAATEASAHCPADGDATVAVRFNNDVKADDLGRVLSVEPAVPFKIGHQFTGDYNDVRLTGAFQPATRYAIKIAAPPAGTPSSALGRYPRPTTLSVFVPDRPAGVWFEHDEGYLSSAGNRTLMAHATNVHDLRVTVTRVYDNNLVAWRNAADRRRWTDTGPYSFPVATKRIELPREKNKALDVPVSLDDILPPDAREDGVYRVSLGADANADAAPGDGDWDGLLGGRAGRGGLTSAVVTLSDIGLSAKAGRDGATTVWVVSLRTAEPLPGVRVRLFSDKGQLLASGTTGNDGLAKLPAVQPAAGERASVLLADKPKVDGGRAKDEGRNAGPSPSSSFILPPSSFDLTWLDLRTGELTSGDYDTGGRPYLRNGHEAFVYADRGVYRPGETVHLRAILRGPDGATPPPFPVLWQLRRPDLRDWKSQTLELDADGAAGLELQLPDDLPTGRWTALVGMSGDKGPAARFLGSVTFQVEEFMPNRLKVGLQFDGADKAGGRYRLGEGDLKTRVQGDYLFGRPASELPAEASVRIEPVTFQPAAWKGWTFGDAADAATATGGSKPLGRRVELPGATLDKDGRAEWELDLPGLIETGEPIAGPAALPDGSRRAAQAPRAPRAPRAGTGPARDYTGPWRLSVAASVAEVGGRAVTANRQVDVDPVPYYVGLRPAESSVRPGEPAAFSLALVAPGGETATADAQIEVTLFRESWNTSLVRDAGHYRYQSTRLLEPVGDATTTAIKGGKGSCQVTAPGGGAYVVRARDAGTGALTTVHFYANEGAWDDNISRENPERLELVVLPAPPADRGLVALGRSLFRRDWAAAAHALEPTVEKPRDPAGLKFRPGERAQVLVRSPFAGRLLLSVETDGIVSTRVLDMPASQVSVPIDVTAACRPNAYVTATVVRAVDPAAKWQPHRAFGVARLPVDNADRKLTVAIDAPADVRPASSLGATVRVTDAAGRPVAGAAVTVAAVDEGICTLTGFKTPDPFAFFAADRALAVRTADLYSQLMPEVDRPEKASAAGGDRDGDAGRHTTPVVARRVRPVSLFTGVLHTDEQGLTRADFPVPVFTGQLRLMAVAYNGPATPAGSGSAERATLVRSPVLVQSSWPRFAAPGDRFAVPLAVFNNGKADAEVKVRVEMTGPAGETGPLGFAGTKDRTITLPATRIKAGGQATLAFEVVASAGRVGVGRARVVAEMGGETFEESVELPVRPANPVTTDGGFAAASPDAPAKVVVPNGLVDGTGRYELRVTSWPSLQLPQGLDYLERYPYGCIEQTTSTCFPLVYLPDVGGQIAPAVFDKERVAAKVQVGITRLVGMQTANGGLAMWPGAGQAWPWASVYAAHFVVEAHAAGHAVPDDFREHLLGYVRGLLNDGGDHGDLLETQAYACYVLALAGRPERAVMARLTEVLNARPAGEQPPTYYYGRSSARFHLAAAWLAAGRRDLATGLVPQVLPAPREGRQLAGNIGSPVRDRALVLNTLLAVDPDRADLPALAQQLADAGRAGQWRSTQDTAFAVMALGRYLRQAKRAEKYDTVELWQGDRRIAAADAGGPLHWAASSAVEGVINTALGKGETADPMPPAATALEVRVTGPAGARAYASWLQTGVPAGPAAAADNGMQVRRRYLDRHGKPLDGDAVRSGDLVQVELTVTATTPLENLVVEDLLPAGLEVENPRLETTAAAVGGTAAPAGGGALGPLDAGRLDVRDDRLVVMGRLAAAGTGRYVYVARAVTPGTFGVPPVRGECMYDLGTNSLSGGGGVLKVLAADAGRVAGVGRE